VIISAKMDLLSHLGLAEAQMKLPDFGQLLMAIYFQWRLTALSMP
jgi:hypothetical protein